jgi:tetratricopeptide (TPR) repeat protein
VIYHDFNTDEYYLDPINYYDDMQKSIDGLKQRKTPTDAKSNRNIKFNDVLDKYLNKAKQKDCSFIEDYAEILANVDIRLNQIKINDMAYYLSLSDDKYVVSISAFILRELIDEVPERVTAYLNLADCYWNLESYEKSIEKYKQYIELMQEQNKDIKRIPQRVYDRIKNTE